jgi:hypothetical protein
MKVIIIVAATFLGILSTLGQVHTTGQKLTPDQIERALIGVDPWPSFYSGVPWSSASWDNLLRAAKMIQTCDRQSVMEALTDFQRQQHGANMVDGKLFVLMRILFQLPEHAPLDKRFAFGGWITHRDPAVSDLHGDGTVNLAWPIMWTNGRPRLVSGFQGLQGQPYDAAREFRYLIDQYPMRALPHLPEQDDEHQAVRLRSTGMYFKMREGQVSFAQLERAARDQVLYIEPSVDWTFLRDVTGSIDPLNDKSFLTIKFALDSPAREFVVIFGSDGHLQSASEAHHKPPAPKAHHDSSLKE